MEPLQPDDPTDIGGYVLTARLGQGGMGEVFYGHGPGGRPVAVKLIDRAHGADPAFRRRFKREVEAARSVNGYYTAQVIDADPDAVPRPWMVTAYVSGPSLKQVLDEHGSLPPSTVRWMGAGLADALRAVHAADVIHRDLKPSNVLIAEDGPRVIDFGIARAAEASQITLSGRPGPGTPAFMAPELIDGSREQTSASDVFSLGMVLAHAAGVQPFGVGNGQQMMHRIVYNAPDLTDLERLDTDLAALVRACLAKDPAERPTIDELLDRLPQGARPDAWLPPDVRTMVTRREAAASRAFARTSAKTRPLGVPTAPVPSRARTHTASLGGSVVSGVGGFLMMLSLIGMSVAIVVGGKIVKIHPSFTAGLVAGLAAGGVVAACCSPFIGSRDRASTARVVGVDLLVILGMIISIPAGGSLRLGVVSSLYGILIFAVIMFPTLVWLADGSLPELPEILGPLVDGDPVAAGSAVVGAALGVAAGESISMKAGTGSGLGLGVAGGVVAGVAVVLVAILAGKARRWRSPA